MHILYSSLISGSIGFSWGEYYCYFIQQLSYVQLLFIQKHYTLSRLRILTLKNKSSKDNNFFVTKAIAKDRQHWKFCNVKQKRKIYSEFIRRIFGPKIMRFSSSGYVLAAHKARIVTKCSESEKVIVLPHSPYSPDAPPPP